MVGVVLNAMLALRVSLALSSTAMIYRGLDLLYLLLTRGGTWRR
jgi:hypothetical protein